MISLICNCNYIDSYLETSKLLDDIKLCNIQFTTIKIQIQQGPLSKLTIFKIIIRNFDMF